MTEGEASEAAIDLLYKAYYKEMGGAGAPPELPARSSDPVRDNVTAFKRPPVPRNKPAAPGAPTKPRLPVGLIFACLVVVYVGIRYYLMQ